MRLRTAAARRMSVAAHWSTFIFMGALLFDVPLLMALAGVLSAAMVIFSLITLPVERNASDRALKMLEQTGLAASSEREGVRKVLRAAAFTYVMALAQRLRTFLVFMVAVVAARGIGQV